MSDLSVATIEALYYKQIKNLSLQAYWKGRK